MEEETRALRRKKKIAGVDDPLVIIQRILNIFRQLHILDDVTKENFNNMILQQPPEIRHMCAILPGGSLLQEYVDDLEEERGIAPDQVVKSLNDIKPAAESESKDNILANAIADTDTIAEPKPQEALSSETETLAAPVSAVSDDAQKQMLMMMQAVQNNMQQAPAIANATIKTDPSFAKDIATAISAALTVSDRERRKETREFTEKLTQNQMQMTKALVKHIAQVNTANVNNSPITTTDASGVRIIDNTPAITKAITESQLEMAKMFLQHNAISASASNSSSNNANTIQINTAGNSSGGQELVGDIIKAQSQLFREMAREQTKELSAIISVSLRETSQQNNKQLINALGAFQKENLKFFKEQAKNRPVVHYQAPVSDDNVAYEYVEQEFVENEAPVAEEEPSYIKKVFGNVFSRAHNKSESDPQEALMMSEDEPVEPIVPVTTQKAEEYQFNEAPVEENSEATMDVNAENEISSDEYEISNDGLGLSTIDNQVKKKKKKKKKNKNKINPEENGQVENVTGYAPIYAQNTSAREPHEDLDSWSFEHNTGALSKNSFDLDSSLFDLDNEEAMASSAPTVNETASLDEDAFSKLDISIFEEALENKEETSFEFEEILSDPQPHDTNTLQVNSDTKIEIFADTPNDDENIIEANWEEESQEKTSLDIDLEAENIEKLNQQETENDANWEVLDIETQANPNEVPAQSYISSIIPDLQDQSAIDEILAQNLQEISDQQSVDLSTNYTSVLDKNAAEEAESSEGDSSEGDSEWEWEYEEVSEDEAIANPKIEALTTDGEDSEWEWEYEEVPENEVIADSTIEAQTTTGEDSEWEWEYEEVSEDEAIANPKIEALTTAAEDSEWEWEYEEVSEDEVTTDPKIEVQATANEDSEWEWEYEEVSEDEALENSPIGMQMVEEATASEVSPLDSEEITWSPEKKDAHFNLDDLDEVKAELGDQEEIGFADLFGTSETKNNVETMEESFLNIDPYDGRNTPSGGEDLGLNSLQAGSLYFQEDVTKPQRNKNESSKLSEDLESDLLLPEFGDDDHLDEPYKLNSDIKP